DCTVNKNGADEAHIIHMRSTAIRVVDGKYISRVDVGAELFQDCFALEVQCSYVDGDIPASLHHGVALRVAERRRKHQGVNDKRVASPQNLLAHKVHTCGESVFEHFKRDRV